jgi:hypothetical protein
MTNLRICKNNQWKRFIGFETIPTMSEVILHHRFFYIFLKGQILGDVHSIIICIYFRSPCKKIKNTSMGDVCSLNCQLVLVSMPKPIFPHQVHIWKRWLCQVLNLNGLGQWSSPHVLNYQRNNPIIGVPNLWKHMEYSHEFTSHNNPNQQSH